MLGIDYNKIEDMVSRMEGVASSMEKSSKRVLLAAEAMASTGEDFANSNRDVHVHLDGSAVRQAALAEMDKGRARE